MGNPAFGIQWTGFTEQQARAVAEALNKLEAVPLADMKVLEANLAAAQARERVLREALGSIARNTCCDRCQEAALVAQSALSAPQDDSALRALMVEAALDGLDEASKAYNDDDHHGHSDPVLDHQDAGRLAGPRMNFTWRMYQNADKSWDAVLLSDGSEVERDTFDTTADAKTWIRRRLRELGAL
jgi:hypothetical protein